MALKGFLLLLVMLAVISVPVIVCVVLQSDFERENREANEWLKLYHDDTITLDDDVIEFLEAMEGDDD